MTDCPKRDEIVRNPLSANELPSRYSLYQLAYWLEQMMPDHPVEKLKGWPENLRRLGDYLEEQK